MVAVWVGGVDDVVGEGFGFPEFAGFEVVVGAAVGAEVGGDGPAALFGVAVVVFDDVVEVAAGGGDVAAGVSAGGVLGADVEGEGCVGGVGEGSGWRGGVSSVAVGVFGVLVGGVVGDEVSVVLGECGGVGARRSAGCLGVWPLTVGG